MTESQIIDVAKTCYSDALEVTQYYSVAVAQVTESKLVWDPESEDKKWDSEESCMLLTHWSTYTAVEYLSDEENATFRLSFCMYVLIVLDAWLGLAFLVGACKDCKERRNKDERFIPAPKRNEQAKTAQAQAIDQEESRKMNEFDGRANKYKVDEDGAEDPNIKSQEDPIENANTYKSGTHMATKG